MTLLPTLLDKDVDVTDRPVVLVAEDDADVAALFRDVLEGAGIEAHIVSDGAGTLLSVGEHVPDLVLLDLDLPDLDGLDVLAAIRRRGRIPVIILTGRRAEDDRVDGLDNGADDYIMKPFSPRELFCARIRAVLRRVVDEPVVSSKVHVGVLEIDLDAREVRVANERVPFTRREFDLLAFLVTHPHRVFTRQELLGEVWGSSEEWQVAATVTEHVRRIRLKIEVDARNPRFIHNVRGVGYRFEADHSTERVVGAGPRQP